MAFFEHPPDVERGMRRSDARIGIERPIQAVAVFDERILKQRPIIFDIRRRKPIAPAAGFFGARNPLMLGVHFAAEGDGKTEVPLQFVKPSSDEILVFINEIVRVQCAEIVRPVLSVMMRPDVEAQ